MAWFCFPGDSLFILGLNYSNFPGLLGNMFYFLGFLSTSMVIYVCLKGFEVVFMCEVLVPFLAASNENFGRWACVRN